MYIYSLERNLYKPQVELSIKSRICGPNFWGTEFMHFSLFLILMLSNLMYKEQKKKSIQYTSRHEQLREMLVTPPLYWCSN